MEQSDSVYKLLRFVLAADRLVLSLSRGISQ